jgi:outer membrane lipoprotein LolB
VSSSGAKPERRGFLPGWLGLLLVGTLSMSACRTLPTGETRQDWPAVKAARQTLASWEMTGRAAVATPSEGFSAKLRWVQSGSRSEAFIQGALGVGGVHVTSENGALQVDTSKGEHIGPDEAGPALERMIGVELPIRELRYWLLGVPAPDSPGEEQVDELGRLTALDQAGWRITFERFSQQGSSWLPARTRLERETVRVRVVADRWDLQGS